MAIIDTAPEIPPPKLQQTVDLDVAFIKNFFYEHLEQARLEGQLSQTISLEEGGDAVFGAMIGVFTLARMQATPLMIQEFVNNNFRGLFGTMAFTQL